MPPVIQVQPDRPFDDRQIHNMNAALGNLFQTVEKSRINRENRDISNIISSINPINPGTNQRKTDQAINLEAKTAIDSYRLSRGKPGIFSSLNPFAPTGTPGSTPIEQGLNQRNINNLFITPEALQKRELVGAQIEATKQLGEQRKTDATGISRLTPTSEVNIVQDLIKNAEAIGPASGFRAAKTTIEGLNVSPEKKQELLKTFRNNFTDEDQFEMDEMESMIANKINLGERKRANGPALNSLIKGIKKGTFGILGFGKKVSEKENDNIKFDILKDLDISKGTLSNNLLALKESIIDSDLGGNAGKTPSKQDFTKEDLAIDMISKNFSFEDDDLEEKIHGGDETISDRLNAAFVIILKGAADLDDYKSKYKTILERINSSDDKEDALKQLEQTIGISKLNQPGQPGVPGNFNEQGVPNPTNQARAAFA